MPRGPASGNPSGTSGSPVPSENRTVDFTGPRRWGAFDRVVAEAEGVKSPSQTTPLAWKARKPGCLPKISFIVSTICSGSPFGSSAPIPRREAAAIALSTSRRWISRVIVRSGFWFWPERGPSEFDRI